MKCLLDVVVTNLGKSSTYLMHAKSGLNPVCAVFNRIHWMSITSDLFLASPVGICSSHRFLWYHPAESISKSVSEVDITIQSVIFNTSHLVWGLLSDWLMATSVCRNLYLPVAIIYKRVEDWYTVTKPIRLRRIAQTSYRIMLMTHHKITDMKTGCVI